MENCLNVWSDVPSLAHCLNQGWGNQSPGALQNGGEWSYLHPIHLCALGETRPGQVDTGLSNSHSPQKGDPVGTDGSMSGKVMKKVGFLSLIHLRLPWMFSSADKDLMTFISTHNNALKIYMYK